MRRRQNYVKATRAIAIGDLIELEVKNEGGTLQGLVIAEVVGQTLDRKSGPPLVHVTPLAASRDVIRDCVPHNLATPNAIHLCDGPAEGISIASDDRHIWRVKQWRNRSRASMTEDWATVIHEFRGALDAVLLARDQPLRGAAPGCW